VGSLTGVGGGNGAEAFEALAGGVDLIELEDQVVGEGRRSYSIVSWMLALAEIRTTDLPAGDLHGAAVGLEDDLAGELSLGVPGWSLRATPMLVVAGDEWLGSRRRR